MSTRALFLVPGLILVSLLAGCSITTGLLPTQPTGVTQQLMMRALERGLADLDVPRLGARRVQIEVFAQAGQQGDQPRPVNDVFVREFVITWLRAHGVRAVTTDPELTLKVFAAVLGTDRGETLIGLPAFTAPVVNVGIPEIALFKWTRNRGQSEMRVFAFDARTGEFVDQLPPGVGRSKSDDFTVLLFIGFSVSDVEQRLP
jgi:hypothetical protein